MKKIYINIDFQTTRILKPWRLRVRKGRDEAVAIYFATFEEAERVRRMLRKTINGLFQLEGI